MFSKLIRGLKESITKAIGASFIDQIAIDINEHQISGYPKTKMFTYHPPLFEEGQLVVVKYHKNYPHLHQEVGIITDVCDGVHAHNGPQNHFYEVLVGTQKVIIIERYLDSVEENE